MLRSSGTGADVSRNHDVQVDATSVLIGDSLSDVEFGRCVGIKTIFIEGNPKHRKPGAEADALAGTEKLVSRARSASG